MRGSEARCCSRASEPKYDQGRSEVKNPRIVSCRHRLFATDAVRWSLATLLLGLAPCAATGNGHGHSPSGAGYSIQSLNTPIPDFVTTGDTVTIRITEIGRAHV